MLARRRRGEGRRGVSRTSATAISAPCRASCSARVLFANERRLLGMWGPMSVVFGIGLSLGGPTGYAINPARDLGPRIAHAVLPQRKLFPGDFMNLQVC